VAGIEPVNRNCVPERSGRRLTPNPAGSFPPLINQSISRASFDNPTLAPRRRKTARPPARAVLDLGRGLSGTVACAGREGPPRHRNRNRTGSRRLRSCITIVRSPHLPDSGR